MEGTAKLIMDMLKEEIYASTKGKIGGMLLKPSLSNLKKKMDYAEYGGAPLLGVNGVSVVCHGSSKARAIFKAIEVANTCCESKFVEKLKGKYEQKSEQ
jgi:glycerol-3-phosphate acyltransferase PlsX